MALEFTEFSDKSMRFICRPVAQDSWINILEGAIRSGKTWTLLAKFKQLCKYKVAGQRLITGVSKQTIKNNVLNDLMDLVGPQGYTYNSQSGELNIYGTDWLVMGAKDEGSERYVRGMTVGMAVCDEKTLMPESFSKMLLGRMSPEGARLYASTNPDSPYHYVKKDLLDNAAMRAAGDIWSEHFELDDNLSLSEQIKAKYRRSYTGLFFRRFISGEWCAAEGAIYGSSITDGIFYDDVTRPIGLLGQGGYVARYTPIDYGTANATCFYDVLDDGQTYWIDDEYYWDSRETFQQKTDKQYVDDLERFLAGRLRGAAEPCDQQARRGSEVVIDPSAASFKAEMMQRGIWYCDGDNEVLDGIRMLSSLLAQRKIRIHRRCIYLIKQLLAYAWDDKACKRGEEKPIKHEDHGPDAIRVWAKAKVPDWRIAA